MKTGQNWICSFCGMGQVILDRRYQKSFTPLTVENAAIGNVAIVSEAVVCSNEECRQVSLQIQFGTWTTDRMTSRSQVHNIFHQWQLLPSSTAKPLPDYIPLAIRNDYEEACAIKTRSPKASATLIRRCLQGCIRDFCGIAKARLVDEINELKTRVDSGDAPAGVQADVVAAIDTVRSIGNIGAHMEKDINLIVDVDSDEAQTLVELAELLFDEWYVARHGRQKRIEAIAAVAEAKRLEIGEQKRLQAPK